MPLEIEYFSCLSCGATYKVAEMKPGTKFPCSQCGNPLTVPEAPRGNEASTLARDTTDLKKAIEAEKKKAVIVKTSAKKKKPGT